MADQRKSKILRILKDIDVSKKKNYAGRIPNEITVKTFQKTNLGIDIIICKNDEDFFNQLEL